MGRRHVLVALCWCLVLGAGCQGITTDQPTVTPAEVPSANGTATTDVDELIEQHRAELRNQSHTTTVTLTVEYPNGTTARRTDAFAVGPEGGYLYERRTVGPYPETVENLSVWQNQTHEVRRENGTITVQRSSGVSDTSLSQFLQRVLGVFELDAESADGGYRLTGSAERAQSIPLPTVLLDHRNATVELTVRGDVLRTATVDLQADRYESGETVDIEIAVTVENVGATQPTRPDWVEDATGDG